MNFHLGTNKILFMTLSSIGQILGLYDEIQIFALNGSEFLSLIFFSWITQQLGLKITNRGYFWAVLVQRIIFIGK